MKTHRLILALAIASAASARADIKLPAVISDHMVLQQETKTNLWGWADAGEKVGVKFAGKSGETVAAADGKWSLKLEGLKAGTAGDLVVSGKNTITVKDVLVGEVWVASGQSNMEWIVQNSANPQEEIANAKWPEIRMFTLQKASSETPKDDCIGKWEVCAPEVAANFSAVGYFFARRLHQTLKQPVGIIHTSWGGTNAYVWTPEPVLAGHPSFAKKYVDPWKATKAAYPEAKAKFDEAMKTWEAEAAKAKAEGKPEPKRPNAPRGAGDAFGSPGCLYNAMIAPILGYTIQGAIWYQGESNANPAEAREYRLLFPSMIVAWRRMWAAAGNAGLENPEFPFLYVSLANFMARRDDPSATSWWAELRESQLATLELPRTGMALAIDIGDDKDIHPKNKQEVGRRLALNAEALVYFREIEYSGPVYGGSQIEDGKIRLSFRNADEMKASDGGKLKGFAIAGEDKKFVWAESVEIQGDHLVVSSSKVPKPAAVRYGWADNPEVNLVNKAGLPAAPFRTDSWPQQ